VVGWQEGGAVGEVGAGGFDGVEEVGETAVAIHVGYEFAGFVCFGSAGEVVVVYFQVEREVA
jgi:hypothetical protein